MKKKALALAVAGAFFAPASYAAQDNQGMHYTSAAEGFYASIRAVFRTKDDKDGDAGIVDGYSRFGVRGSNDLGNGLKGFYQFEANAPIEDSGAVKARLGHVGLQGAFGSVWVGSGWGSDRSWTSGVTDVSNFSSGTFAGAGIRGGRLGNMIHYTTPDINGFQAALSAQTADNADDQNVDRWSVAGKYSVQGFTGAFAYQVKPDGKAKADNALDDQTAWSARLGYAQDNWYVNGWYGKDNDSDFKGTMVSVNGVNKMVKKDTKYVSIAGGVSVGKVNMYGVWEQKDLSDDMSEDVASALGVTYNLGSRSRVWLEYAGVDKDSDKDAEDFMNIGLRHDF